MSERQFSPWKLDRSRGTKSLLWASGAGAGAIFFAAYGNAPLSLGLLLAAVVLTKMAASWLKRAGNREFGKVFEEEFVHRALRELEAHKMQAQANVMARGIGDIDLVARVGIHPVTIEIKSFKRWNQFLIFKGVREGKALVQAERQRRALGARHGLVWLPQGRPTLLQRFFGAGAGSVGVVFGNERALVRALKRMD